MNCTNFVSTTILRHCQPKTFVQMLCLAGKLRVWAHEVDKCWYKMVEQGIYT